MIHSRLSKNSRCLSRWYDIKKACSHYIYRGLDLTEYFEHLKRDCKELLEKEPQNAEYHRENLSMGGES